MMMLILLTWLVKVRRTLHNNRRRMLMMTMMITVLLSWCASSPITIAAVVVSGRSLATRLAEMTMEISWRRWRNSAVYEFSSLKIDSISSGVIILSTRWVAMSHGQEMVLLLYPILWLWSDRFHRFVHRQQQEGVVWVNVVWC